MRYLLGVDLGTTSTAAAVVRGGHAEAVPLGDHAPQVPSVVFRPPSGALQFGEAAARHALTEPSRVAGEFKRRFGGDTKIYLAGTPMSAVALSHALLAWVVDRVTEGQGGPPAGVTVTHPANWGSFRRDLMQQVIALDPGIATRLITEPEAAAIHFASTGRLDVGQHVAVYDLGGGTFDAAILRRTGPTGFELVGEAGGVEELGGIDFDEAVFRHVLSLADLSDADLSDPDAEAALRRLRRDCIDAKEALSGDIAVSVPVRVGSHRSTVRLNRHEFEELIHPLIAESVAVLERVIRRAGLAPAELAAVLAVGGSSRVPLVAEMLTQSLQRPVVVSAQPKLSVAMGAALLGAGELNGSAEPAATPAIAITVPQPAAPAAVSPAAQIPTAQVPAVQALAPQAPIVPAPSAPPEPSVLNPPATPATEPGESRPARAHLLRAARIRRSAAWHLASAIAGLIAIALATLGVHVSATQELTWSGDPPIATGRPGDAWRSADELQPTLLGIKLSDPIKAGKTGFDLSGQQVFLGGSLRADLTTRNGTSEVLLVPGDGTLGKRILTIPGVAMILAALFSFAYAESLLRAIRKGRRTVAAGEVVGLVGSGAVAGLSLVTAVWVLGGRFLETPFAIATWLCACAGVGLLAFGWERESER